jgi:cytochrome P450
VTQPAVRRALWALLRVMPVVRLGERVIVTRHADVAQVLERHRDFSVRKYGARMRSAGADFFLGHDEDELRLELRGPAEQALRAADPTRVPRLARELSRGAIERAAGGGDHLDAIEGLVETVPVELVEAFFGVPNPGGRTMLEWNQLIAWSIFNPFSGAEDHERARVAGAQFSRHLADLVRRYADGEGGEGTVLGELVRILRDGKVADWERKAVDTISGLINGTLGPGPQMLANAFDRLLDLEGRQRRELHAAAGEGDLDTLEAYLLEAGRMLPAPPMLYRAVERSTTLMGKPIEPGLTMLCVVESALRDRRVISRPGRFRPERWSPRSAGPDPMIFGRGLHWCFGRDLGMDMLVAMTRELFALPGLRRAAGRAGRLRAGRLGHSPEQNHPSHLLVRFDRPASER